MTTNFHPRGPLLPVSQTFNLQCAAGLTHSPGVRTFLFPKSGKMQSIDIRFAKIHWDCQSYRQVKHPWVVLEDAWRSASSPRDSGYDWASRTLGESFPLSRGIERMRGRGGGDVLPQSV